MKSISPSLAPVPSENSSILSTFRAEAVLLDDVKGAEMVKIPKSIWCQVDSTTDGSRFGSQLKDADAR